MAVLACPPDRLRAPIVGAHKMPAALILDRVERAALLVDNHDANQHRPGNGASSSWSTLGVDAAIGRLVS
jgi:hypothetical protein